MESLLAGDPVRLGRYSVVGRVERAAGPEWAGSEVRLLGRAAGGGRTVVLSVPAAGLAGEAECAARFRAEAVNSQAVRGSWLYEVTEVAEPGAAGAADEPVWHAGEYVPQLGLPGVLGVLGGPLPVGSVRAWGAALAEALAAVHGAGLVHGGVVPGNVRVTARGPSLAGFGAVRVASVEGTDRTALPGLNVRCLAPELLTGGRPRPASDVFALGAVLAYAATAHSPYEDVAEHDTPPAEVARRISRDEAQLVAVPGELREIVERCLKQDPAERPSAATVAELLRGDGGADSAEDAGSEGAVGDVSTRILTPSRPDGDAADDGDGDDEPGGADVPTLLVGAGAGAGAGAARAAEDSAVVAEQPVFGAELAHSTRWLPRRVWAEISRQTTRALLAEGPDADAVRTDPPDPAEQSEGPVPEDTHPLAADAAAAGTATPASSRRTTLVAALAGAVGVLAGGTALQLWRPLESEAAGGTSNKAADADAKPPGGEPSGEKTGPPAASGKRLPPKPLWRRGLPGDAMSGPVVCWNNRVLVVPTRYAVLGLELRTGKQLWARRDVDSVRDVVLTGADQVAVLAPEELVLLSPKNGAVVARIPASDLRDSKSDGNPSILHAGKGELWISAPSATSAATLFPGHDLQRFDLGAREERWRVPVSDKGREVRERHTARAYPDEKLVLVATQDRDEDRDHGAVRIAGLDLGSGERRWEREVKGISAEARVTLTASPALALVSAGNKLVAYDPQRGRRLWSHSADPSPLLGHGTLAGDLVYVTDVGNTTHALDVRSGEPRWSNGPGAKLAQVSFPPTTSVSRAGDTVLVTSAAEVDAFDAKEGSLRWRFADVDTTDKDGPREGRLHLLNDELVAVRVGSDLLVLPVR